MNGNEDASEKKTVVSACHDDGDAPAMMRPIQRIGPFELLGVLGSGGMGVVHRGRTERGTMAAVKVLERNVDDRFLLRFEREAAIRIEHPNVVRVLDACIERLDAFQRAQNLYALARDHRRAAGAAVNLADVYNRVGLYERAEDALRRALDECKKVGNLPMTGYALALLTDGRGDQARSVFERARARIHELAHSIADAALRTHFVEDVSAHRELMRGSLVRVIAGGGAG